MSDVQYPESDIAIVGMGGRFPGAPDPETPLGSASSPATTASTISIASC